MNARQTQEGELTTALDLLRLEWRTGGGVAAEQRGEGPGEILAGSPRQQVEVGDEVTDVELGWRPLSRRDL